MHSVNFWFKTTAGIKIPHRKDTFCFLVHAGSNLHFLSQRDLEDAQDTFFEKCEILSKTNGNSSNRSLYELLKHDNIQNPPRIISKIETSYFTQFDRLPRAPNWPFMPVPTLPLKAQRGSKFTPIRPIEMGHLVRFVLCFPYFGAPLLGAIFRLPGVCHARRSLLI